MLYTWLWTKLGTWDVAEMRLEFWGAEDCEDMPVALEGVATALFTNPAIPT